MGRWDMKAGRMIKLAVVCVAIVALAVFVWYAAKSG